MESVAEVLPISLGILSFKAYNTIDNTLGHHSGNKNLFKHLSEVKVFFQTFCNRDKEIAEKYGVNYQYREENIGIQAGIRWVVENMKSDYILYLENDFIPLYDVNYMLETLKKSIKLIEDGKIDMMRLRSRFRAGEPFEDVKKYTKMFVPKQIHKDFVDYNKIVKTNKLIKYIRPLKAIKISARSLYIEQNPEQICKYIKKYDENTYIVDSCVLNWTNNPTLISKKLFLELLDYADKHPSSRTVYGFQDLEKPLNCRWWRKQHFKIGVCDGIFTHNRIDR